MYITIKNNEIDAIVFDDITDTDLARQRLTSKINDYLGHNCLGHWKDFNLQLVDDVVNIAKGVAKTFGVDEKMLLKMLPVTTITRREQANYIAYSEHDAVEKLLQREKKS